MDRTAWFIFLLCCSSTGAVVLQTTLEPPVIAKPAGTGPSDLAWGDADPDLDTPLRETRIEPLNFLATSGSLAGKDKTIALEKRFDHLTNTLDKLIENLTYDREWRTYRDDERRKSFDTYEDRLRQDIGQKFKSTLKSADDRSRRHDNSLWQMYSRLAKFEKLVLEKDHSKQDAQRILVQKHMPTVFQEQIPEHEEIQPSGDGEMEWVPDQNQVPRRRHHRHHARGKPASVPVGKSTSMSEQEPSAAKNYEKKHEHFSTDLVPGNAKWKIQEKQKEKDRAARQRKRNRHPAQDEDTGDVDNYDPN